ncbi:MAG TPA: amidohydrolase family protein [Rhodanobacteraceae bacterium]|nr:amidohydrolase family protein [Rhodanobacteraceae bacterium]
MAHDDHSDPHEHPAWHGCGCCSQPPVAGAAQRPSNANPLEAAASVPSTLRLDQFRPRSTLHARTTRIDKPAAPVIDAHTHLSWMARTRNGISLGEAMIYFAEPAELVALMDRKGIAAMINLTGGVGSGLEATIARFEHAAAGRFHTMTEPSLHLFTRPDYPKLQADAIARARDAGACGLKVLKTLGLYLRERLDEGPLVPLDDARFDPMWEACGTQQMPVFIHTADPLAFFDPTDGTNERYEELSHHPDWSFYGADHPSHAALVQARERVIARHPHTTFVLMHVGNQAIDLDAVDALLTRRANVLVDISARINELGRQPRRSRAFIEKFQDRILFGTDAVPPPYGNDVPQQLLCNELYDIYYRFLETEDEYFDYAPAEFPPQGRWRIAGLGLSRDVLRKLYHDNVARLMRWKT